MSDPESPIKIFVAEKRSSQVVSVSFSAGDENSSEEISKALVLVVSQNTQMLNKEQKEDTWFDIAAEEPVIVKNEMKVMFVFLVSLAIGIFLGFWVVMVKYYLK
jgi:capsular polysaccharide biosynthesis protein